MPENKTTAAQKLAFLIAALRQKGRKALSSIVAISLAIGALVAVAGAGVAHAEEGVGAITATVKDQENQPVANYPVLVLDEQ
ncbi:MAG: hypothetical protein Q4C71_05815, partial [Microbacteriaceae bacterium]|nr:hypothetical protein [Microbacteriaceae bacterium]